MTRLNDGEQRLQELRTMSVQAGATAARWTLATLTLMNGGALVTVAKGPTTGSIINAGAFFVWGLVAAVLSGFALTAAQWGLTYMAIQSEGGNDPTDVSIAVVVIAAACAVILAVASLALFAAGCMHAATAMEIVSTR